jgi:hypothetical protein
MTDGDVGAAAPAKRRQRSRRKKPADFWRELPDDELDTDVVPARDPTAAIRSLGTPPLPGQGTVADHYLAAVVARAAGLATALAAAADILVTPPEE